MILDTNALSAAADNDPGLAAVLARADQMALPVIVLGEYRHGIAQSRHRAATKTGWRSYSKTAWSSTFRNRPRIITPRSP